MQNPAYTTKHSTVEIYAVAHILNNDYSLIKTENKINIGDIISELKSYTNYSNEQNKCLDLYLRYFYTHKKYELIHFIRELVLAGIGISYKYVPFFKTVVENMSNLVRSSRIIANTL